MNIKKILIGLYLMFLVCPMFAAQQILVSQINGFTQGVLTVMNNVPIQQAATAYTVIGPQSNVIVATAVYSVGLSNWVVSQDYLSSAVLSNSATTTFVSNTVSAATNDLWGDRRAHV